MWFRAMYSTSGSRAAALMLAVAGILVCTTGAFGSFNKATWITQASNTLQTQMPRVDAFMWFNNYKPGMSEPDWRIVPDAPAVPDPAVITAYNNAWHNGAWSLSRGVFIDGEPPGSSKLSNFESYVGHHDRVGWYGSFTTPASSFLAAVQAVDARGSRPYVVWQPYDDGRGYTSRGSNSLLGQINLGVYDNTITDWANKAKTSGIQMDISFGHEANCKDFSWSYLPDDYYTNGAPTLTNPNLAGHNGNTPAAYLLAYKRVVNIFRQNGATNVSFVWDVNADWGNNITVAYPTGTDPYTQKDYVDRMGMNGFNWGRQPRPPGGPYNWDDWRELSETFGQWWPGTMFSTYTTLAGLNTNKPIIIGEFGTNTPEPATLAFLVLGGLWLVRYRRR